jgi:hypothetical protein
VLEKLRSDLEHNRISLADAIVKALPALKDKQNDATMSWLSSELQGYSNPLNFYYKNNQSFPPYRVVEGSLKLMKEGNLVNFEHPLADRSKYFLSAPVAWLEESYLLPGDLCLTEMSELSHDKTSTDVIVIAYTHKQLQGTLTEIKKRLIALLR